MNRGQNLSEVVDGTYDVILCNQVLYYMSDSDLDHTLKQLANCLKSGGLIYITMMSTLNYYWNYSSPLENGLHEVNLSGRLEETSYINLCAVKTTSVGRLTHLNANFWAITISQSEKALRTIISFWAGKNSSAR